MRNNILKEAKRIEEDSIYSSKSHFNTARFWSNLHLWLGVPAVMLAAVASAFAFSEYDNHGLVGFLAIIASALSAVNIFLNPNEKANSHHNAGNQYNALKNNARILSEIYLNVDGNNEDILKKMEKMNDKRNDLNEKSPQIPRWAFKKARRGIKEGEADYKIKN